MPPQLPIFWLSCSSRPLHGIFWCLGVHVVIAAGGGIARCGQAGHAADVSGDLPDLIVGDFAAIGGHAIGPAFDDGGENLLGLAAVNPFLIHERRAHAAAAVCVAADAVHRLVHSLAFGHRWGIFLI